MYQIFVSHTQLDKEFCDTFDRVCARVGIKAFRSEFETIGIPAWETIKKAMSQSIAMFLLVGKQLTTQQANNPPEWKHTQNWIAYETGLACQKGIDVWVFCDAGVEINFPVPYFNNYALFGLGSKGNFDFMKGILTHYSNGNTYAAPFPGRAIHCPYNNCGIKFNLHSKLDPGTSIPCPQCLQPMHFNEGFLLK